jgi:hypothetical protein
MSIDTIMMIMAIIIFLIIPSLKDRKISIKKLTITPIVFLYLLYQTVSEKFHLDGNSITIVTLGLLIGITGGILLRKNTPVTIDKNNSAIFLPGSYLSLMLFVMIFSVHYIIGYQEAVNPVFFQQLSMNYYLILFALALVSALSTGMNLCLFYKYHTTAT